MKFNKILILTIVLLAMISFSAVSAADDVGGLDDGSDILSVSQDETNQLTSDNYNKTVYVDSQGDDSGAGTEKSPYASLNKAISSVDASDNAVIYMGAGIYSGENNTDLKINLAHKNYNGSLTIAGAGAGKTIIDANLESPIFTSISADSIVVLKDITFINGKNNLGSAITNNGDLTIDSCVFENNSAGAYATVYQDDANNLKVVNSVFRDNVAGSANADIYYYDENAGYNVTLINSSFYNAQSTYTWGDSASVVIQATNVLVQGNTFTNISSSGKSSLHVRSPNGKVINNVFKDCSYTGSSGAILYIAGPSVYLEGNTFENYSSSTDSPIYAVMNFNANLAFNDLFVDETSFKLTCNVTDDMKNPVTSYYKVQFYFDGKKVGEASANGGVATLSLSKLLENGTYDLTGEYGDDNPLECKVVNGTVTVDFDHNPLDVWVSATGNDTAGDGSESNPFLTIKHAIDFAIDEDSVYITVHVKEGLYNISGDYGLSYSDVADISIIGESYGKVIIDGNNKNGFLTSGVYTNVFLKNLTFVNGTGSSSRSFNVRYLTMKDCIVNNIGQLYAQNNPSQVVLDNVIWTNTKQLTIYNGEIYNSHFENITSSGTGNLWLTTVSNDDVIVIMNSEFVNLVCTGYSGTGVAYVQGNFVSINNTYASNKATSRSYGALYVSGNKIISINDTFIDNEAAADYGAACFYPSNVNSTVKVINAKFINNTAGGNGGALGLYGGEIINSTFENNTAGALGGAIYAPTHGTSVYLYDLTLDGVTFDGNAATTNGQDIFITQTTSASAIQTNLNGMTVSMNDLSTTTLQDFVYANVTHESGAIVGGGAVKFYLNGSYMGVANVVDGVATLDYLGFKTNGTFVLSGEYNLATNDTAYNNATVVVALAPLKDNVTLYVSDSRGDDVNGTGSLDKPYKTIKTALSNGYKQSAVIVVRVLEGNYSGVLNNNLTVAASLDISIVGDGKGVTIIDCQDISWFFKILAGDGIIRIENMTVANVTKNYVDAKQYNQMPALTIEKGAVVSLDGVEFIRCHGTEGGAIFNEGTLDVVNSRFFNNGDSNNGAAIKNMGTVTIDNSEFIANHAKFFSTIYNDGLLFISNSLIQDAMRVNGWTGNAIAVGGKGNTTIYNSTISRSGKTSNELIGTGQTWANNPGFVIGIVSTSGTVKVFDCVIDGNSKAYSAQYVSNYAFGGTNGVPLNVEVANTKIVNVLGLVMNSKGNNLFDSCYFENMTNLHTSTSYDFNLTVVNSYFADGTTVVAKKATANVVLDNNWWGTNDKPTYKVSNVATSPNTWLILTLNLTDEPGPVHELTLAFQVTDGENITDYVDEVYPREYVVSVLDGTSNLTTGVIFNEVKGQFEDLDQGLYRIVATVDGQTLKITEKGYSDILAENVELMVGETQFDVQVLVNNVSVGGFNINLTVNNKTYVVPVIDGIASFEIEELAYGNYTLDYVIEDNDACFGTSNSANLTVLRYDPVISMVSNATDEVIIILTGNNDVPLTNAEISYSVDGNEFENITDDNGQIIISGVKGIVDIIASYDGDKIYNPIAVEENVTVYNGRKETVIAILGVDGNLCVVGALLDIDAIPIANATIKYTVGNYTDNVTTDEKGTFAILADNGLITFYYAETLDYEASGTYLYLKDIAPVRQTTEIEIALGDIKINNDLNINISVSNVTGELFVYVDDNDPDTIPVTDGKANYTIKAVTAGTHNIFVVYLGDIYHESSVATKSFPVEKLDSEINVTVSDAKVGEIATISVNVTEGATGFAVVNVGGCKYLINLGETDSIELIFDEACSLNVTAYYLGDDIYDVAVSDDATLTISDKAPANIEVSLPEVIEVGDTIDINVTADTDADLFVSVNDEIQTLINGTVKYTIDKADRYVILVMSEETADYKKGMFIGDFIVNKTEAVVTITLPENITIGEEMEIGVETNSDAELLVYIDGYKYEVVNGTVKIFNLEGEYNIIAYVNATDKFTEAKAMTKYEVDKKDATIEISGADAFVNQKTTINVTLSDDAYGYVLLTVDQVVVYSSAVPNNGTIEVVFDKPGNYTLYAIYMGNNLYYGAVSNEITIVVSPKENVVSNVTGLEGLEAGEDANITVTVPNATGMVTVNVGDFVDDVVLDENGTANVVIPSVNGGNQTLVVIYYGDESHNAFTDVYAFSVAKQTTEANITLPTDFKIGDAANVTVAIPGATGNVSVIIDGDETTVSLDENGTAVVPIAKILPGDHSVVVVYSGDETHAPMHEAATFFAEVFDAKFVNLTVDGDGLISGYIYVLGTPMANVNLTYTVNGVATNISTDKDGKFSFNVVFPAIVDIHYPGTDDVYPADASITFKDIAYVREATVIKAEDYYTDAIDYYAGERGGYFKVQLLDAQGNPLANKEVKIGFNGVVYEKPTDENGWAQLQINLAGAGTYTFAVAFLGDNEYNGSFVVQKIVVNKKKTSISASAKSYKASASKSYTVTLKTDKGSSIDGKTYLQSGKKITLKLNGKTYTAKTNSKGQATFKLSITKKGKFTAAISFEGDKTYEASSKSVKITIN